MKFKNYKELAKVLLKLKDSLEDLSLVFGIHNFNFYNFIACLKTTIKD